MQPHHDHHADDHESFLWNAVYCWYYLLVMFCYIGVVLKHWIFSILGLLPVSKIVPNIKDGNHRGKYLNIIELCDMLQGYYFFIASINSVFGTQTEDPRRASCIQKLRDFTYSIAFPFAIYAAYESIVGLWDDSLFEPSPESEIRKGYYYFNLAAILFHIVEMAEPRTFSTGILNQGLILLFLIFIWSVILQTPLPDEQYISILNTRLLRAALPIASVEAKLLLWAFKSQREFSQEVRYYIQAFYSLF